MIVFHQLERNDLVKIVALEVAKAIKRVRAKAIKVHLDTTAVEFLIDKGYDPQPTALDRCAVLWRNTWRIHWPRSSCEETSSRATRWRCTRLVNNWRSRGLSRNKVNRQTGIR